MNFLELIDASVAVIGVGRNNKFGHPNNEVLKRLKQNEIQIYRTDENGEIVIKSNGTNIEVYAHKRGSDAPSFVCLAENYKSIISSFSCMPIVGIIA